MKYMLLIYSNEARRRADFDNLSEAEQNGILGEYFAISETPGGAHAADAGWAAN